MQPSVMRYLFPCALHGLLRDTVDLLLHIHFVRISTPQSHKEHPKAGASEVQSQEITMF